MPAELLAVDFSGRFLQEWLDHIAGGNVRTAEVQLIEPLANGVHGVDFQPFAETRFVADQASSVWSAGAFARVSEKVVSNTLASGLVRARKTARCSATIVLPVPAEPETRAGPL